MFGSLKEKLKSWISKNEEQEVVEKTVKKKANKKTVKKETKKSQKKQVEEEKQEIIEEPEKKSFLSRFQKKITEEKFEELFEELELILLQNNVALEAVESIKESLKKNIVGKNAKEVSIAQELKYSIEKLLIDPPNTISEIKKSIKEKKPYVILFAGINGAGKTTSIAKVAKLLQKNKLSVCVAAADTFRAASIEQIQEHCNNLKIQLIKKDYGSDPASVGFDAIQYAKKQNIDVVLIDTAGRLQNKDSLMREIEKIARVNKPDLKIFLGESITGNDATDQAKTFNEVIGLDGIILSKADVDEKGGTAISVSHVTGKPILFLGTGQAYEDLEVFDKKKLLKKLDL